MNAHRRHNDRRRAVIATAALSSFALLMIAVAACGDDSPSPTPSPDSSIGSPAPSSATPETLPADCSSQDQGLIALQELSGDDGQYTQGEEVTITLRLINCGDNNVNRFFPTGQRYDFFIENEATGVEVWSWADSQTFEQAVGEERIPPRETVTYTETWDQRDSNGDQVPPARYKVYTYGVGCPVAPPSNTPTPTVFPTCHFGPVRLLDISE